MKISDARSRPATLIIPLHILQRRLEDRLHEISKELDQDYMHLANILCS